MESTSPSAEDTYVCDIITGAHGDKYQKDLALVIFERATIKKYDFRLAYEMDIADKFNDVALFNNKERVWTFIQTKHADTSKGIPPPLNYDSLFPLDIGTREKGDFSLFKYLKSYVILQKNIKERKKIIIFTNRELLADSFEQAVEVESRKVEQILQFEHARHVGFKVKDSLVKEMIDFVNRDFNVLRNSIVKLFTEGIIEQPIKNYITPVREILTKTENYVKLSVCASKEANKLLESLSGIIDIKTAQIPLKKYDALFSMNSRNKIFPPFADESIVQIFFQDLILSVGQPDDLRYFIDQNLRCWMRTWMRPTYFQYLEETQLKMCSFELERFFDENQTPLKTADFRKSCKRFLKLNDGERFFVEIKGNMESQISKFSNFKATNDFYIPQQIEYTALFAKDNGVKMRISDHNFVNELFGKFEDQRFLLLTDEPGMGKSTIMEFIAFNAQQKTNDCVYYFDLNGFNKKLRHIKESDQFEKLCSVFETVLSVTNFNTLKDVLQGKDTKTKHFMIFDAFDDIFSQNRNKVFKIFDILLTAPSVTVFVSAQRNIKGLLEETFNVKAMWLVPFNGQDKIDYLRQFWKKENAWNEECESRFLQYVTYLFKSFNSDINHALCEMIGLPLMLKVMAEIHASHFNQFLNSEKNILNESVPQKIANTLNYYEQLEKKCFAHKMMKKSVNLCMETYEDILINNWWFEKFALEHVLLAITHLQVKGLNFIFEDEKHVNTLTWFENSIMNGIDRSPLVETFNNNFVLIHPSYSGFVVSKFLLQNLEKYEAQIFAVDSDSNVFGRYPVIRHFFFAMIEESITHLEILKRHYKKNSRIILWACEARGLKTVQYLLRAPCDITLIRQLLGVAAQHNCSNICAYLLQNYHVKGDCKVDANNGTTPLHIAAEYGHTDVVQLLMDHSDDINVKDNDDLIPLDFAVLFDRPDVIKLLTKSS